ncbi:SWIM zinc finger family protein [Halomicroarcula sp. GCM10025709]|uniref:SWIM zinc finger family protein n=1 Tax=Haloarcula TaxID=2237 RepID=UPI0024C451B0|nr:SWIM zinc finger family protein [Halomicroarcula sp. YJ-61-S]
MATTDTPTEIDVEEAGPDKRTVAALTEVMTVLDSIGRARDAPGLYLVNSSSGSEYLVDTFQGTCECPWSQYNPGQECKHRKRVAFATGERPIPEWIDADALDDQFGMHVDGEPRRAVADGGVAQARVDDGGVTDPAEDLFAVHSEDDPRTKRAKRESIDVAFLEQPGVYEVHSASDSRYEVDVLEETCTCPDTADRCKHLRRVDIEIREGLVPRPDGKLPDA